MAASIDQIVLPSLIVCQNRAPVSTSQERRAEGAAVDACGGSQHGHRSRRWAPEPRQRALTRSPPEAPRARSRINDGGPDPEIHCLLRARCR